MLYRIGYIEQMGTGIMRMKNAAKEAKVAEPEFELSGFFKVTFKRDKPDVPSGRQAAAKRPLSGHKRPQAAVPADRKQAVISFLEECGKAKSSDFINVVDLSAGRVRDLLRAMVNDGTIEKVGDDRYTYYILKR
jgi:predicted HTH transcriptional regulator